VFEKEPPENNPLVGHPKVVCTPHLGASTTEAQENVALAIAEQIADYLVRGVIRNAVNFPSIPADQMSTLQPYVALAEKVGSFASQIFDDGVSEVSIELSGEAAELTAAPITIAVLKGVLSPGMQENVNFVNAPFIAKERGIQVKEVKSKDSGDYQSLLGVRLKSARKELFVAGTLFSKNEPWILRIDNFNVEVVPEGTMLFMHNNDKPGVIGNIGTLLGSNGINIARMHFGRESAGGRAVSVVNIDSPVTDKIIADIRKLPNILDVKVINI
jgi:D-3-phosphoglycerate dehydrogenase